MQDGINLIKQFIEGVITAPEFKKQYMDLWKFWRDNNIIHDESVQSIFDDLFIECDAYCADPTLRDKHDIDEQGLKEAAEHALRRLKKMSIK